MNTPQVLIVEDEPHVREELVALAQRAGFATLEACNGEEALKVLDSSRPDLMVTDVHMPDLGGRQLIGLLRRLPDIGDLPVMVVTADNRRATKVDLLTVGADDFIGKPVDPDEFIARLRAMGKQANLRGQLELVTGERDRAMSELATRNRELEQLTLTLVAALENNDALHEAEVGNHIRRVCDYASMLAEVAGCEPGFIDGMRRHASLHDVGKVGIRDAILVKTQALTQEEEEELKAHTLIGGELLRAAGMPSVAINIAQHHHECWDGTGFPHGLSGEAIPVEARIVAVVDAFDDLVTEHLTRRALSFGEARQRLLGEAGQRLDPTLVKLFFDQEDRIAEICARHVDEPILRDAWA